MSLMAVLNLMVFNLVEEWVQTRVTGSTVKKMKTPMPRLLKKTTVGNQEDLEEVEKIT